MTTQKDEFCMEWSVESKKKFPDKGLEHNYCRNPDGKDTIWCYTDMNETKWDYCDKRDPILQFVYICENNPIQIIGTNIKFSKETVLSITLANDLITITCLIGFLSCLEWIQKQFA